MEAKSSEPQPTESEAQAGAQPAEQFESSLARLEEIVKYLELGQVGLDESVELFREGKGLAARCERLLQSAEQAIARLSDA